MLNENKIWFGKAGEEKIYALPKMAAHVKRKQNLVW